MPGSDLGPGSCVARAWPTRVAGKATLEVCIAVFDFLVAVRVFIFISICDFFRRPAGEAIFVSGPLWFAGPFSTSRQVLWRVPTEQGPRTASRRGRGI